MNLIVVQDDKKIELYKLCIKKTMFMDLTIIFLMDFFYLIETTIINYDL